MIGIRIPDFCHGQFPPSPSSRLLQLSRKRREDGTAKKQDAREPLGVTAEAAMAAWPEHWLGQSKLGLQGARPSWMLSSSMWSGSGFVWFKLFLFFRLRLLPRSWQDSSWVRFHLRANQIRTPDTRLEVHSLQLSHEIIFTTLGFQEIITSETYHLQPQNQACGNFKNCMIILSPLMHYDAGLDLGPVTYTCCSVVVWWHAYTL